MRCLTTDIARFLPTENTFETGPGILGRKNSLQAVKFQLQTVLKIQTETLVDQTHGGLQGNRSLASNAFGLFFKTLAGQ